MQCLAHPTSVATNTCSRCNHWLCDDCTVEVQGRLLCRSCITAMDAGSFHSVAAAHTAMPAPLSYTAPSYSMHKHVNWGLLFLFSCFFPPGTNYMYMGLIKRGLAAMCGFFLLIYLTVTAFAFPLAALLALTIPVYWFTCLFDGFHTRRRINSGETVEDGVGDVLNGVLRNKALAIAILVLIVLAFAGSFFGIAVELVRLAVPMLLIALALLLIFNRRSK